MSTPSKAFARSGKSPRDIGIIILPGTPSEKGETGVLKQNNFANLAKLARLE
ncbi:hypothetical protein MTR62_11810 [Novosphingobium sp. 1949]|uniref:Uncharacterized protein n=1 Tax=Novosphingobium organovorum TaxID=2930092 RepID=A0ABT0BE81_9SPHN|nr:hypothetical protein [Novosphingobium organovorum]MCJ2183370.1 hypothetical protein [Novosphingobium organovorum]